MKSISFIIISIALIAGIYYYTINNNKNNFSVSNLIISSEKKIEKKQINNDLTNKLNNIKQEPVVVEMPFPEKYKENPPLGTQFINKRYLASNGLSEDKFKDLVTKIEKEKSLTNNIDNLIIVENNSNFKDNQLQLGNDGGENVCGARGFGEQCGGGDNPLGLGVCTNAIAVPIYEQCKYTSLILPPSQDVGPGCPSDVAYSDDCTCQTLTCLPEGLKSSPSGCPASVPQRCLSHSSYVCNGPIGGIVVSGDTVKIDIYTPCAKRRTLVEICSIKPISCDQCCGGRSWLWDSVGNGCGCA